MISKISFILLLTLSTEISFGNLWGKPTIPKKVKLTEEDFKEIKDNISEFTDFVTLNETTKFWKKPHFPSCLNDESIDYNIAIFISKQEIMRKLRNYLDNSKLGQESFIAETEKRAEELCDLIDEVRSQIYMKTYNSDFEEEDVKSFINQVKASIENNFVYIYQNIFTIKKTNKSNFQNKNWMEAKKTFIEKMKEIMEKSIEFVKRIEACINSKTK